MYPLPAGFFFLLINNLGADWVKKWRCCLLAQQNFYVVTGFSRPQCEILYKDNFERCYNEFHRYTQIYKVIFFLTFHNWYEDVHYHKNLKVSKLLCSGSLCITVSNNDCGVREYDMERFQLLNHFRYNWPVNVSSVHLDHISYFLFHHPYMTVRNCFLNKTAHICESG